MFMSKEPLPNRGTNVKKILFYLFLLIVELFLTILIINILINITYFIKELLFPRT